MNLGKLSPADLADLISLIAPLEASYEEANRLLAENPEKLTPPGFFKPAWYEFYQMPFVEHAAHVALYTGQAEDLIAYAAQENPTRAAIQSTKQSMAKPDDEAFDETDRPILALAFGFSLSLYLSLKSLMTFGLYLNELVALAGENTKESDKALFSAVKIDPTVIACSNIASRLSLAVILNDQEFLNKLQKALSGKLTKREQKTYQHQRLVLQILQEVGAPKLHQDDLYELFVKQLDIVADDRNSDVGDVANNLRQFAYQFMKQKSVSQN